MANEGKMDNENSFLDKKVIIDFCDPQTVHDRVIMVQGKRFYVTSMHLSLFSEYFTGLFNSNFQEKNQTEIELKDIGADEFETFLKMLYPFDVQVTRENLPGLIKLSGMFLTPFIWQKCIKFVDDPSNFHLFQFEEMLDYLNVSKSKEFKEKAESRCIDLFEITQISKFLEIVADNMFEALKKHIVNCLITHSDKETLMERNVVKMILENKFETIEDVFINNCDGIQRAHAMFTIFQLLKYDLPDLEQWFVENFHRLLIEPEPVVNVREIIVELGPLSRDSKTKLRIILLKWRDAIKNRELSSDNQQGLKNLVSELAFLLYNDNHKDVITKCYELLTDFPCDLKLSDLEEVFDANLMKDFENGMNFRSISLVVHNDLKKSKCQMREWIENGKAAQLKGNMDLLRQSRHSSLVDIFVRNALFNHTNRFDIVKHIFG